MIATSSTLSNSTPAGVSDSKMIAYSLSRQPPAGRPNRLADSLKGIWGGRGSALTLASIVRRASGAGGGQVQHELNDKTNCYSPPRATKRGLPLRARTSSEIDEPSR